jgi:hypothetical protein
MWFGSACGWRILLIRLPAAHICYESRRRLTRVLGTPLGKIIGGPQKSHAEFNK